jgi:hypothetical protein
VRFLSGPSSLEESRSWPSLQTSVRLQGIPPPTPNSSPSVAQPSPQAAGDLPAVPSTPPWNRAPCAPAPSTQAVSLAYSTRPRIPKPDTQAPSTIPLPTPASIIPSSSKAAFSKKAPPHYSATSSSVVAGDQKRPKKRPKKPPFFGINNTPYNVLELEVNSYRYSNLSMNQYYKAISGPEHNGA